MVCSHKGAAAQPCTCCPRLGMAASSPNSLHRAACHGNSAAGVAARGGGGGPLLGHASPAETGVSGCPSDQQHLHASAPRQAAAPAPRHSQAQMSPWCLSCLTT